MSSPAEQQQERISIGLIEYLSRHTLDEDYEQIARNRPGRRSTWLATAAMMATLALFGGAGLHRREPDDPQREHGRA